MNVLTESRDAIQLKNHIIKQLSRSIKDNLGPKALGVDGMLERDYAKLLKVNIKDNMIGITWPSYRNTKGRGTTFDSNDQTGPNRVFNMVAKEGHLIVDKYLQSKGVKAFEESKYDNFESIFISEFIKRMS